MLKSIFLFLVPGFWLLAGEPLYYSFATSENGGVARLRADPATGEVLEHKTLFVHEEAVKIKKVALSQNRHFLAANLEDVEDAGNIVLLDLREGSARFLDLKGEADHLLFVENRLYVGSTAGRLFRVNPEAGEIEKEWDFRKLLDPSGRRPEDFVHDSEANHLWVSFQKDSRQQRHRGSRLVGIDLTTHRIFADLQLPRDHPDLHYPIEVDGRESGPNPEVLRVSPNTNTLFVTLDLYGAVGMADLDAAREGRLQNWTVRSTAPDGSFGSAFPDRVGDLQLQGRDLIVVANASQAGGLAVVDPRAREVMQMAPVFGGLSTLESVPFADMLVSGSPGKIKARTPEGLSNNRTPVTVWMLFEIREGEAPLLPVPLSMETPVHRVMPVDRNRSSLVYLNLGERADEWVVIDVRTRKVHGRVKAFGSVGRTNRLP
ncbi:MAG: hypothetical protein JJU29_04875 [Verrucomicrobia bacterium]|nr:hypothetical protein [Verrucomicrobiota bacterium]MCH8510258.1 hypothetical protein [Kiritimatiellia bacterium]